MDDCAEAPEPTAQFLFAPQVDPMTLHKVCAAPGCTDLASDGSARCHVHASEAKARLAARRAAAKLSPEAVAGAALYADPRWRKSAAQFLKRFPLCADCGELGGVTPATEVDHIDPHRGDRAKFWDKRNWQPLCKRCHSRKTAREVFHSAP